MADVLRRERRARNRAFGWGVVLGIWIASGAVWLLRLARKGWFA